MAENVFEKKIFFNFQINQFYSNDKLVIEFTRKKNFILRHL